MKSNRLILTLFIALLLIISMKAYLNHKRSELAKSISPKVKYEVASQSRQGEEKYWEGDF